MLYLIASYTGLRAAELASLTPMSFLLDERPPLVRVAAAYSKHRREDHVPLHPDLIAEIAPWLASKPIDALLWPGKWAEHFSAVDLIQRDLRNAQQAWLAEVPEGSPERTRLRKCQPL